MKVESDHHELKKIYTPEIMAELLALQAEVSAVYCSIAAALNINTNDHDAEYSSGQSQDKRED